MKENLTAEINYLRTLNLQFVEQQAKGALCALLSFDKMTILMYYISRVLQVTKGRFCWRK